MSKKNTYKVYRTGSLSGTVIFNIVKAPSKGFTYIKAKRKKGERVFYLNRERNFVGASHADTFSSEEAHEISMEMRNLRKNYEFTIFSTSEPLNDRAQKVEEENPTSETPKEQVAQPKKKSKSTLSKKHSQEPVKHDHGAPPSPPQIYIGMTVSHKQFGEGAIVKIDKTSTYISVAFSRGEKHFGYPHCFEKGFLEVKV